MTDVERPGSPLVLVTRPGPQAAQWVQALHEKGVQAAALPLLAIAGPPDPDSLRAMWRSLRPATLVMFVSPNAVAAFFAALEAPRDWPQGVWAAGTGPGTVAELLSRGVPSSWIVAPPEDAPQFDSEALWACLSRQDWAGRQVWIVRGDGGRDWFARTLEQAGARVSFVQAYRRQRPCWSETEWRHARQALAYPDRIWWHFSSSESLDHLALLLPDLPRARSRAMATHPRIAERTRAFGFGTVVSIRPGWAEIAAAAVC